VNEKDYIGDAQDYIFSKDQVKIDQQTQEESKCDQGVRTTEWLSRGQVIDGTFISMKRDE
jgi:hypothetical protein